jgi:hypothetical protein
MFSPVTDPVVMSNVNEPLAEPAGEWFTKNATFDSVKVTNSSAVARLDPPKSTAMIENAVNAVPSFNFMIPSNRPPSPQHTVHAEVPSVNSGGHAIFWTTFSLREFYAAATQTRLWR